MTVRNRQLEKQRTYRTACVLLTCALSAALLGGAGGLSSPLPGRASLLAASMGILLAVFLLPFVVVFTAQARASGIPRAWRAFGCVLTLVALLLPAWLLASTSISAPRYDAFDCGALVDRGSYLPRPDDPDLVRGICDPVRETRAKQAGSAAVAAVVATGALAVGAFRPVRVSKSD